jgi:UDP-N-acetylglucosamine 2-epimerase (non-hydrolysing)
LEIAIILGTRPEIIKMSPIIRECERNYNFFIIHSGQHYSYNMDHIFFEQLELSRPKINLGVGSGPHGEQTGKMLIKLEAVLKDERPDLVLVQGDTNTALAGALAASKMRIKIGHIEAGMRSFDRNMPEEINRILIDHISDYLFVPNINAKKNLLNEGVPDAQIFVCGNTITEAVFQNLKIAEKIYNPDLYPKSYFLATIHRQENTDTSERLDNILKGLGNLYDEFKLPIVFPIHPRTKKNLETFGLILPKGIELIEPLGYLEFLQLEKNAKLILTDSGGVQEEACILGVSCVTLRDTTEWIETLEVEANVLAGHNPEAILSCSRSMLERKTWKNPFGDDDSSRKIMDVISSKMQIIY